MAHQSNDVDASVAYRDDLTTLIRGEAIETLLKLRHEGCKASALISDPPYSSGGMTRSDRQQTTSAKYRNKDRSSAWYWDHDFTGDNRDDRSWERWTTWWMQLCAPLLEKGSIVAVFCDWRRLTNASTALQMAGFVFRGVAVWDKGPSARPQPGRFRNQCEFVVWGSLGPHPMTGPPLPGVFRHTPTTEKKFHQTGKPVGLMMDILKIVPAGGCVLDPFAGSGSTLVAARIMGLRSIGIEWSGEICSIAAARLQDPELVTVSGPLFNSEPDPAP